EVRSAKCEEMLRNVLCRAGTLYETARPFQRDALTTIAWLLPRFLLLLLVALGFSSFKQCALRALLLILGPLGPGGGMEDQPAGWLARMPASFSSGHEPLSKNPAIPPRTLRAQPTK